MSRCLGDVGLAGGLGERDGPTSFEWDNKSSASKALWRMQRWGGGHWGSNEGCGVWPRVADRLMNGSLGEFKRVGRRAGTNS